MVPGRRDLHFPGSRSAPLPQQVASGKLRHCEPCIQGFRMRGPIEQELRASDLQIFRPARLLLDPRLHMNLELVLALHLTCPGDPPIWYGGCFNSLNWDPVLQRLMKFAGAVPAYPLTGEGSATMKQSPAVLRRLI